MSLERRLARLEGSVTPQGAVLSWLAEAHGSRTLPDYVRSLLDAPKEDWPLVRIGTRVEATVRGVMRGRPEAAVWRSVRRRVGDAFFLFELVLRLNLAAEETLRLEGLRWAALTLLMRELSHGAHFGAPRRGRDDPALPGRREADWQTWREAASGLLTGLYAEEEARADLERRYLDGRPVLFPELAEGWERLRGQAEGLALAAARLPSLSSPAELTGDEAAVLERLRNDADAAVPARAQELVDLARAFTLDALGETERAVAIIARGLRAGETGSASTPRTGHVDTVEGRP